MNSLLYKLCAFGLLTLLSCDTSKEPAEASETTTPDAALPEQTPETEPEPKPAADPEPEPEPEPLEPLQPQLVQAPPSQSELEALKTPVGELEGESFKDATLVGVARVSCGEGVMIQPIFRENGQLQVGIPTRLEVGSLKTPGIEYTDGPFRISASFEEDSPERLKGTLEVAYDLGERQGTYLRLSVDTKPFLAQIPPKMAGKKELPFYPRCTPSGYFRAWSGDEDVQGYVNIIDVKETGAPFVSVVLSPYDTLQFLIIPPSDQMEFKEAIELDLSEAHRRGHRPAGLIAKALQVLPVAPEDEARTKNLGLLKESSILEGKAKIVLTRDSQKQWRLQMTLNDLVLSPALRGRLQNRVFERVEIEGILMPESPIARIPDAPDWWRGEADDREKEKRE